LLREAAVGFASAALSWWSGVVLQELWSAANSGRRMNLNCMGSQTFL
jgi:hypothetical protein